MNKMFINGLKEFEKKAINFPNIKPIQPFFLQQENQEKAPRLKDPDHFPIPENVKPTQTKKTETQSVQKQQPAANLPVTPTVVTQQPAQQPVTDVQFPTESNKQIQLPKTLEGYWKINSSTIDQPETSTTVSAIEPQNISSSKLFDRTLQTDWKNNTQKYDMNKTIEDIKKNIPDPNVQNKYLQIAKMRHSIGANFAMPQSNMSSDQEFVDSINKGKVGYLNNIKNVSPGDYRSAVSRMINLKQSGQPIDTATFNETILPVSISGSIALMPKDMDYDYWASLNRHEKDAVYHKWAEISQEKYDKENPKGKSWYDWTARDFRDLFGKAPVYESGTEQKEVLLESDNFYTKLKAWSEDPQTDQSAVKEEMDRMKNIWNSRAMNPKYRPVPLREDNNPISGITENKLYTPKPLVDTNQNQNQSEGFNFGNFLTGSLLGQNEGFGSMITPLNLILAYFGMKMLSGFLNRE